MEFFNIDDFAKLLQDGLGKRQKDEEERIKVIRDHANSLLDQLLDSAAENDVIAILGWALSKREIQLYFKQILRHGVPPEAYFEKSQEMFREYLSHAYVEELQRLSGVEQDHEGRH